MQHDPELGRQKTRADLEWAFSVFSSRAFKTFSGSAALVPGLDLCNHSSSPSAFQCVVPEGPIRSRGPGFTLTLTHKVRWASPGLHEHSALHPQGYRAAQNTAPYSPVCTCMAVN